MGAGDTFIAGVLYGLVGSWSSQSEEIDYQRTLGFATRLAGLKVKRDGFNGLGEDVIKPVDPQ